MFKEYKWCEYRKENRQYKNKTRQYVQQVLNNNLDILIWFPCMTIYLMEKTYKF